MADRPHKAHTPTCDWCATEPCPYEPEPSPEPCDRWTEPAETQPQPSSSHAALHPCLVRPDRDTVCTPDTPPDPETCRACYEAVTTAARVEWSLVTQSFYVTWGYGPDRAILARFNTPQKAREYLETIRPTAPREPSWTLEL